MPTLITDLSPTQRMWLFETLGTSPEEEELQSSLGQAHFNENSTSTEQRRVSDSTGMNSEPPVQDPYPPPHGMSTLTNSPDNRSAIFRRGQEEPRSWSPNPHDFPPYEPKLGASTFAWMRASFPRSSSRNSNPLGFDEKPPKQSASQSDELVYPHRGDKLTWQQSYENLKVYKSVVGDCDVPQKYKKNQKLGGWVNKQRKKKKNPGKYGKLTPSQIEMLENIGFRWNVEQT